MLFKKLAAAISLFYVLSSPAQASVVYDESVNGDLSNAPSTLISLSLGSNTILGSSLFATNAQRDQDSFLFQLLPGQYAVSGIYQVLSRNFSGNTTMMRTHFDLYDQGSNLLGGYNVNLLLNQESIFGYLGAGIYAVDNPSFNRTGQGGSWNYAIIIEVGQIPEPGSLALAGLALAGLAQMRRKSAKAA